VHCGETLDESNGTAHMSPSSEQVGIKELRRLLRVELIARFAHAGWQPDGDPDGAHTAVIVAFRRQLTDDFSATAKFARSSVGWPDRPPLVVDCVEVGVSYEPLRRLWPAWADFGGFDELAEDVGELMDPPRELKAALSRAADVSRVADELSRPVLDHALTFAARHANIDELFEAHRAWNLQQYDTGDPGEKAVWEASAFEHECLAIPAWLAATGRLDESRQALADYLRTERPYARSKEYARYAQRLIQWLDAQEQPPAAPPRT
jgi:hypothetical protein